MPRQDGKVVIVTGGSRGIGYEVVRHMVALGAHVIIGTFKVLHQDRRACADWIINIIMLIADSDKYDVMMSILQFCPKKEIKEKLRSKG